MATYSPSSISISVHRQVPIGQYIVDFYCHELMFAIEVDGSSHEFPEASINDLKRQQKIENMGVHFLRFEESEVVHNYHTVLDTISRWIAEHKNE